MRIRTCALLSLAGLLVLGTSALGQVTTTVTLKWAERDFELRPEAGGTVSVRLAGGASAAEPGRPDLPWALVRVPLPAPGVGVASWSFEPATPELLARAVIPVPAWRDVPSDAGGPVLPAPDPAVYGGAAPWPPQPVLFRGVQVRAGRAEASFLVCPVRWDPLTRDLERLPGGTLTVRSAAGAGPGDVVTPRRPVADDPTPAVGAEKTSGGALFSLRGGLTPTARPSLDSVPVEFLVITSEALVASFQPLVAWKNRDGYPAAIRTVEAIARDYPQGVDLAESIRLFLRDAYALWGTRTVILGGDPSLIPIRYARSYAYNLPMGTSIATDYYYACLDGNWNADGDNIFGEAVFQGYSYESDKVDLRPELKVGRISALNATQVSNWVQKYLKYARDPDPTPGYLDGILSLGEVLFDADWRLGNADSCVASGPTPCVRNDGASECFLMVDSVKASMYGSFFSFDELYEREYWWNPLRGINARQLNRTNTLGSLNAGRNIVYHMGHGDRDRWAIGTGRLLTSDVAQLTNGPRYSGLAYVVNCNSAAVDADCVGEAWQLSANGGGVNYFGSTNLDFPVAARQIQNAFFHRWLNNPAETPGSTYFAVADSFGARQGDGEGTTRFLLYGLILLGDPDLNVWRCQPKALQVTVSQNFALGAGAARVSVRDSGGHPLSGARVSFYKEDDALGVALTSSNGSADVAFAPTSTGTFRITVTHPLAKPYQVAGLVGSALASWPVATGYTVVDDGTGGTRGNGNGRIEAGETVALDLAYANRGAAAASNVIARLHRAESVPSLRVEFADSTQSIGSIPRDGSGTSSRAFLLTIRESALPPAGSANRVALPLTIDWVAQDGLHSQRILPEVDRPDLELIHTVTWETALPAGGVPDSLPNDGETMALFVELYNQGRGDWNRLRARLEPMVPGAATMIDSVAAFPPLLPGTSALSDTMRFLVRSNFLFRLRLVIEDTTGVQPQTLWTRLLQLRRFPTSPPASLVTQGEPNSVSLAWDKPPNTGLVWGYRVYRADSANGEFRRISPGFVKATRYVRYDDLPDMTRYWFQVAAIDSSGIEGPRTAPTVASSSPGLQAGWPVAVDESRDACPTIENLNGWGPNEVVILSKDIYCLSANADDYYDGDGIPSTRGVLTRTADAQNFLGKCAVADINGDHQPEVIALATNNELGNWDPPASLCVFDHVGRLLWSKVVTNRPALGAPAIGNIDDDPEPEIVFICGRWLFAYNHDGTPFGGMDEGKLMVIPGGEQSPPKLDFQYCSPALADLDGDGRDEIVFTTTSSDGNFSKLYVVNGLEGSGDPPQYATNVPGFPFTYASVATDQPSNASPAIADVTSKATGEPDGTTGSPRPDIIISTKSRLWVFDPWAIGADKRVWTLALEPQVLENPLNSSPAIGDIDGDGKLDIAVAGGKGYLYVVHGTDGTALSGFITSPTERYLAVAPMSARLGSPILADLDGVIDSGSGKRLPEVVIGDNLGTVYALRKDGSGLNGFPFTVPGGKIGIGLAAWDVDRDGYQNLVIQSDKVQEVQVLDLRTCPFSPDDGVANPWPAFRHDPRNTGSALSPPGPTPVQTVALEAEAGTAGVTLRWRTELAVRSFVLSRAAEPGGDWVTLGEWPMAQAMEAPGSFALTDLPPPGTWRYRIEALDLAGRVQQSGETVVTAGAGTPLVFRLQPAKPNPFNPHTLIRLDVPRPAICDLRVVDAAGRTVRRLLAGGAGPGTVEVTWDGTDDDGHPLGSGVFFLRATADGLGRSVQKVVLLK
jgi:hypothetical protein